jgi:FkbM family methyltransferase
MSPDARETRAAWKVEPEYGAYRLAGNGERLRAWATNRDARDGRSLLLSLVRRMLLIGRSNPIDLDIFPGVSARIHPRTNRCEKAALVGARFWDAEERLAIAEQMRGGRREEEFVFIDAGANVGFYSLFVARTALDLGRATRVIAIEPDAENLKRLRTNIAVNAFDIEVLPVALGESASRGTLMGGEVNRGERHLAIDAGDGDIEIVTLSKAAELVGVERVNCLKLDIEGHDHAALRGFFADAPRSLWPLMIIVEVGRNGDPPIEDLCVQHGYQLRLRTRLNAIFGREAAADDRLEI